MESLLRALRLTTTPDPQTVTGEDAALEPEEPPDDYVPEMNLFKKECFGRRSSKLTLPRRESLLTQSLRPDSEVSPTSPGVRRGLSTTSSHSFASTAELTSDLESPLRSATPSPPPPVARKISFAPIEPTKPADRIVIAPLTSDDRSTTVTATDAAAEKTLGRKRCIMFACNNDAQEQPTLSNVKPEPRKVEPDVPVRKSKISFACTAAVPASNLKPANNGQEVRRQSSPPPMKKSLSIALPETRRATESVLPTSSSRKTSEQGVDLVTKDELAVTPVFHEFGSSYKEQEAWVRKPIEMSKPKLTIDDCLKKENAIRKIGREAEEEAEAEERELDALENECSDNDDQEDDFAPSDDESNGGNESDDENGFAASDDESDADSEYQFWAPSTSIAATSADNGTHFSNRPSARSRASSTSSIVSTDAKPLRKALQYKPSASKPIRMRPGTPELPDSTDFVCGTFDEDRPLEAAYISCRELKRKEKRIALPQDIDPSFPTTDPEEEEDEVDEVDAAEESEQPWMKNQFDGFEEDPRDRRRIAGRNSATPEPSTLVFKTPVPAKIALTRSPIAQASTRRNICRSPPANIRAGKPAISARQRARSPAPARGMFARPPQRLRSPPPARKLQSPRGSPTAAKHLPLGITINRLAQRPSTDKTSSLPHTPNPFFKNWNHKTSTQPSRVQSLAASPNTGDLPTDLHVRGPVDIVIGLEKKRQKRKEKFWRQHCKKLQKHPEKKLPHGKGLERMRQHGLECAERFKGYNTGVQPPLVLSV